MILLHVLYFRHNLGDMVSELEREYSGKYKVCYVERLLPIERGEGLGKV